MTLRQLKKLARQRSVGATIVGDGVGGDRRAYVVEVWQAHGAGRLQDSRGRARRFAALADAYRVLRRARVADIQLAAAPMQGSSAR